MKMLDYVENTRKQQTLQLGSAKANRREPKTCLGQVFNYKLGCFDDVHLCGCTTTSIVENCPILVLLAEVCQCSNLSCQNNKNFTALATGASANFFVNH
jgi:hypothetical protein